MKSQLRPILLVVLLSPLTAEFLLGDQYLSGTVDFATQAGMLVSFIAFYGVAAVLIRELARRLRMGWSGLLLLAFGFAVFEEGLITQTLFNPHYLGLDLLAPGYVDALGIGAPWTVFVLSLHVIWSIGVPIAIVEAWRGGDGSPDTSPWMGRAAIVICLIIFILGAAGIGVISTVFAEQPFLARPMQLIAAALLVVLIFLITILLLKDSGQPSDDQPRPVTSRSIIVAIAFGVVSTSAFQVFGQLQDRLAWWSVAGMLAVWAVGLAFMIIRRPIAFGVAAGAVLTYAWVGMLPAIRHGAPAIVEQSVLIITFLLFLAWTGRRLLRPAGQPVRPERTLARG